MALDYRVFVDNYKTSVFEPDTPAVTHIAPLTVVDCQCLSWLLSYVRKGNKKRAYLLMRFVNVGVAVTNIKRLREKGKEQGRISYITTAMRAFGVTIFISSGGKENHRLRQPYFHVFLIQHS